MLLRDDIYDAVRADILACRLAPGEEMREQELAARYNVSRAPVRDALLRLEREQLVTVQPRQGSRVNSISLDDARDIFRYRAALEPACAAMAAQALPEISDKLEKWRHLPPGSEFLDYNRAFHVAVAQASGSRRMAASVSDLLDQAERLVRVSLGSIKGRDPTTLVAEHAALIDAIQAGNARRAARISRDHILKAQRRVLSALARSAVTA